MTGEIRSVEECAVELFDHLGIQRAHIAAGRLVRGDWHGLATKHPERIASLTLISPPMLDPGELAGLAARTLAIAGDRGPTAEGTTKLLAELPNATSCILRGYEYFPWSDLVSERGGEIGTAMLDFLDRFKEGAVATTTLPDQQGEVAGISYRIRGAGPALVLMPLDLASAQWEPLIDQLSKQYCTISLGGPALGAVSLLEGRGRSSYMGVVRALLDAAQVRPGEAILEIGCGSGVVLREIARRTAGGQPHYRHRPQPVPAPRGDEPGDTRGPGRQICSARGARRSNPGCFEQRRCRAFLHGNGGGQRGADAHRAGASD